MQERHLQRVGYRHATASVYGGAKGDLLQVPIPIPGMAWPILVAAFPMTEEAWNSMLEVLKAMKPGLVKPVDDSPAE